MIMFPTLPVSQVWLVNEDLLRVNFLLPQSDDPMSDVSSQKSVGEDSNQLFTSSEANDEKKGEDSWTDVSLNDDSDSVTKTAKVDEKGRKKQWISL